MAQAAGSACAYSAPTTAPPTIPAKPSAMVALPDTKTKHPIVWQSDDRLSAFYNTDAFALMQDIPNDSIDCI